LSFPVRLRAHITIDIEADDFVAAADHQRTVERVLAGLKSDYPQAILDFRERRVRTDARPAPVQTRPRQKTGAVHSYE
jgi:hypothetical protein